MKEIKPPRHFSHVEDLSPKEYIELFKRADKFAKGGDFTKLCRGKVLSTLFFQASTRTVNVFKAAMIRLGGGVIAFEGVAAAYLASGEEDKEDTIHEFDLLSDIIALRDGDPKTLPMATRIATSPVVNGGSGLEEHASGVFYLGYDVFRRFGKIDGLKVCIYGAPGPSRPCKAMVKFFSLFKAKIYVDVTLPELDLPAETYEFARKQGSVVEHAKLDDIIGDIDVLVVEGIPTKFIENKDLIEPYLKAFKPIDKDTMAKMKKNSCVEVVMPRIIKGDLLSITKDVDNDPRVAMKTGSRIWMFGIMALITKLLNVKV